MEAEIREFMHTAFSEDVKDGDHSSLACIPENAQNKARLLIKENGILAGVKLAKEVFRFVDEALQVDVFIEDGSPVESGDVVFQVSGKAQSILTAERIVLNCMQRMSAIATETRKYVDRIVDLNTKILDTRKTTPGIRFMEKWAVLIGGGENHRFGLYDMIMLKDNHIDFAGGMKQAILKTKEYLDQNNKDLKIEVETRNLQEVQEVLSIGGVDRIMLDNFSLEDTRAAVELIDGKYETEASGGVNLNTIRTIAECGVDFVSVGAITHSVHNLDMSLKAMNE
ncbi:MAG TPA: carboxylating nicotinate-nucleotide diphosphorylase [Flavobacteriales bacterium]|nr:carboxylating nicotinate-nucleotide diphosphorylase [Flavobacteriales bacterium]